MNTSSIHNQLAQDINNRNVPLDWFALAAFISNNIHNRDNSWAARDLLIRSLDRHSDIPDPFKGIWQDLIDSCGLYPYINDENASLHAAIRKEYHRSSYLDGITFHEVQYDVAETIMKGRNVILSAPTSFGKSLLIYEVIGSGKYRNIVIVQPTIALLDETRKNIRKKFPDTHLVTNTRLLPHDNAQNVYIMTPERVIEYAHFGDIDFFVIDEFYKLDSARKDERATILNYALYKLSKYNAQFLMIGPNVRAIPESFINRHEAYWLPTTFSTVATNEHRVDYDDDDKDERLHRLLKEDIDGSVLVYCNSPKKAEALAYVHGIFREDLGCPKSTANDWISDWCLSNIHRAYPLISSLRQRVGFHHGAMPRHLSSAIVDQFNKGELDCLFCTSTLIEGVNTSAKNVVLYDKKRGTSKMDFFDFKNICGRSGRMGVHFIGNVYTMEDEPPEKQISLDFPLEDQCLAPDELLFMIDEDDLSVSGQEKIDKYSSYNPDWIFTAKKVPGLPISGQLQLMEYLDQNLEALLADLNWNKLPKYNQLGLCCELIWKYLLPKGANKAEVKTHKQLTYFVSLFMKHHSVQKLISALVASGKNGTPAEAIYLGLNVSRNWFEFKLPKMFNGLTTILEYFSDRGAKADYKYFSMCLEYGFQREEAQELIQANLPHSLIHKLQQMGINTVESFSAVARTQANSFTDYERYLASSYI